ncbi:hypothetical protein M3697_07020 [Janibacter melonis]|uniref:hypothetical protein n=1 Tax=Janibacter melonis TaxID=262209 RepID=UPI002043B977|nr:hypothetical protein [Janibacter melonis]MCM3554856.1 hypothetical protein [Janibacter melonis]
MIHHYDTKWATYEPDGSTRLVTAVEKRDRSFQPMPRYWVHEHEVDRQLGGRWDRSWLAVWRDITNSTNERTTISTVIPRVPVGNKLPVILTKADGDDRSSFQAALSSFALDFASRQKMGGTTMNFFIFMQLPVPRPADLAPYRQRVSMTVDLLNGHALDSTSRREARAELDAIMFHLYGVSRDDVDYVLDTFPIVKRKDEAEFGEYLTKRLILEHYDRLADEGVPA